MPYECTDDNATKKVKSFVERRLEKCQPQRPPVQNGHLQECQGPGWRTSCRCLCHLD